MCVIKCMTIAWILIEKYKYIVILISVTFNSIVTCKKCKFGFVFLIKYILVTF